MRAFRLDVNRNLVEISCNDITRQDWAIENRRVAIDRVGPLEVSTVFLVIEHTGAKAGSMVFETMVFVREDNVQSPWEDWQDRYSSWDDALEGHNAVVNALHGGLDPKDLLH